MKSVCVYSKYHNVIMQIACSYLYSLREKKEVEEDYIEGEKEEEVEEGKKIHIYLYCVLYGMDMT